MKPAGQHSSSNEERPLISVIIPAYNRAKYIAASINSVLDQEYPNLEIIVVDDGSTDETPQVLASFGDKIAILTQTNAGPSAARNLGLKHAKGTVIGFLDSDDLWPKGRLEGLLPYVQQGNKIVRGLTQYIRDIGSEDDRPSDYRLVDINVMSCLYDASVFTDVGLFDESMKYAEDLDWDMRARELGYVELRVPVHALQHRRHNDNLTNAFTQVHQGKVIAFQKKVLRAQQRNK